MVNEITILGLERRDENRDILEFVSFYPLREILFLFCVLLY